MIDLARVVADGTMKALMLHGQDRGLSVDETCAKLPALKEAMKGEYKELRNTLKKAMDAHMGETMYRTIINTYCNAWAAKALAS